MVSCRWTLIGRGFVVLVALLTTRASLGAAPPEVERWGRFELSLPGPRDGNPFFDTTLSARFHQGNRTVDVAGFYDGDGTYRIRFLPEAEGAWHYETRSNRPELDGRSGDFTVVPPKPGNHGPVRLAGTYHFAYADGTPYHPVGTTCYAWTHQGYARETRTLASLAASPFNKIRMAVFPKWYEYNRDEPPLYPFEGTGPNHWDFTRFNPRFFQHLETRIAELADRGIEADLILFHPYDDGHWGFDRMPADVDDRYLRYTIARLASHRNVWWSMANEFDFMKEKVDADWDRFAAIVVASDPYKHLRSIHNGTRIYDLNQPWVTHASIQNGSAVADFGRAGLYRDVYRKPIVLDEVKYEGDFPERWGNLSGEEMVHRFWQGIIAGTYVTHGETYLSPDQVVWWARGDTLKGSSPARLRFLRSVLETVPAGGLEPIDKWQTDNVAGQPGVYYLVYLGNDAPTRWEVVLPRAKLDGPLTLRAEILDTWNGTVTPVPGTWTFRPDGRYRLTCTDRPTLDLPGKPYQAIRWQLANPLETQP